MKLNFTQDPMDKEKAQGHRRSRLRHPIVKYGIPVLFVIILVAMVARPAYRVFRDWRVDRNVVEARAAFES
jgi:hypothetical protein